MFFCGIKFTVLYRSCSMTFKSEYIIFFSGKSRVNILRKEPGRVNLALVASTNTVWNEMRNFALFLYENFSRALALPSLSQPLLVSSRHALSPHQRESAWRDDTKHGVTRVPHF